MSKLVLLKNKSPPPKLKSKNRCQEQGVALYPSDILICNFRFSQGPFGVIFWAMFTPHSSSSPSNFGGNLSPNLPENGNKTKKTKVEKKIAQINVTVFKEQGVALYPFVESYSLMNTEVPAEASSIGLSAASTSMQLFLMTSR